MKDVFDFKTTLLLVLTIIMVGIFYVRYSQMVNNCKGYVVRDAFWGFPKACIEGK